MKRKLLSLLFLHIGICPLMYGQLLKQDNTYTYFAELWNIYESYNKGLRVSIPAMQINHSGKLSMPCLFEASINNQTTVFKGRDNNKHKQLRSTMVYLHPDITLRMYSEDPPGTPTNSLPVRPMNFVIRAGITKFLHSNKIDAGNPYFKHYQFIDFCVAHYSNGQGNSHFYKDSVTSSGDSIPNYESGNFSTNYLRLGFTKGYFDKRRTNYSCQVNAQKDFGGLGVFSYDDAQIHRYGYWRLNCLFQIQSAIIKMNIFGKSYPWTLKGSYQPEIILDNIEKYFGPNKNRISLRFTLVAQNLNWRNVGFFAEYYTGRDYLNIRYYDHIRMFKIGLIANPTYYKPRVKSETH